MPKKIIDKQEDVIKFEDIDISSQYVVGLWNTRVTYTVFTVSINGSVIDIIDTEVYSDKWSEVFLEETDSVLVFESHEREELSLYLSKLLKEVV